MIRAVRFCSDTLGNTTYLNSCVPVPADVDISTHGASTLAVHPQLAPVSTVNDPAPPSAENSRSCGARRKLHPGGGGAGGGGGPGAGGGPGEGAGGAGGGGAKRADCVNGSCWPAIVSVAVRAPPGFGCTLITTAALPAPVAGDTTAHGASLDAVQRHAL